MSKKTSVKGKKTSIGGKSQSLKKDKIPDKKSIDLFIREYYVSNVNSNDTIMYNDLLKKVVKSGYTKQQLDKELIKMNKNRDIYLSSSSRELLMNKNVEHLNIYDTKKDTAKSYQHIKLNPKTEMKKLSTNLKTRRIGKGYMGTDPTPEFKGISTDGEVYVDSPRAQELHRREIGYEYENETVEDPYLTTDPITGETKTNITLPPHDIRIKKVFTYKNARTGREYKASTPPDYWEFPDKKLTFQSKDKTITQNVKLDNDILTTDDLEKTVYYWKASGFDLVPEGSTDDKNLKELKAEFDELSRIGVRRTELIPAKIVEQPIEEVEPEPKISLPFEATLLQRQISPMRQMYATGINKEYPEQMRMLNIPKEDDSIEFVDDDGSKLVKGFLINRQQLSYNTKEGEDVEEDVQVVTHNVYVYRAADNEDDRKNPIIVFRSYAQPSFEWVASKTEPSQMEILYYESDIDVAERKAPEQLRRYLKEARITYTQLGSPAFAFKAERLYPDYEPWTDELNITPKWFVKLQKGDVDELIKYRIETSVNKPIYEKMNNLVIDANDAEILLTEYDMEDPKVKEAYMKILSDTEKNFSPIVEDIANRWDYDNKVNQIGFPEFFDGEKVTIIDDVALIEDIYAIRQRITPSQEDDKIIQNMRLQYSGLYKQIVDKREMSLIEESGKDLPSDMREPMTENVKQIILLESLLSYYDAYDIRGGKDTSKIRDSLNMEQAKFNDLLDKYERFHNLITVRDFVERYDNRRNQFNIDISTEHKTNVLRDIDHEEGKMTLEQSGFAPIDPNKAEEIQVGLRDVIEGTVEQTKIAKQKQQYESLGTMKIRSMYRKKYGGSTKGMKDKEIIQKFLDQDFKKPDKTNSDIIDNPVTWHQFMKGKMSPYMEKYGDHKGAMNQLSKEWKEYKLTDKYIVNKTV